MTLCLYDCTVVWVYKVNYIERNYTREMVYWESFPMADLIAIDCFSSQSPIFTMISQTPLSVTQQIYINQGCFRVTKTNSLV